MFRSHPMFAVLSLVALAAGLSPASASAASREHARGSRTAHVVKSRACAKPPVEVVSGKESATFALAACDGSASADGVDRLSLLTRPTGVSRPKEPLSGGKSHGDLAPGIRRIDPRLVERMERVVEHFRKDGSLPRIVLSPSPPEVAAGRRAMARSLDFSVDGVTGEALASYCKTLSDTGCGFFPQDGHLRMQVRAPGSGHYAWVDSGSTPKAGPAVTSPPDGPAIRLSPLPAASIAVPLAVPVAKPGDSSHFL